MSFIDSNEKFIDKTLFWYDTEEWFDLQLLQNSIRAAVYSKSKRAWKTILIFHICLRFPIGVLGENPFVP